MLTETSVRPISSDSALSAPVAARWFAEIACRKAILLALFFAIGHFFAQGQTFNFTGGVQTYTVPDCVTSLNVVAAGAQGGGGTGGLGATVTGTITVVPGQVIQIFVGGQGQCPGAGFNGGGAGGSAPAAANAGCGGGGASSVAGLIIAAGGGGMGGGNTDAQGGLGGCANGTGGTSPFGQGGGGASQSGGGTGGPPWIASGNTGGTGSSGQGGAGATDPCFNLGPGGGGGGGFFGGGGGGSDCFQFEPLGGGGGGGGSSLTPAGGGCTSGNNPGNGYVTITPASPPMVLSVLPTTPSICEGQSVDLTASGGVTYTWSPAAGLSATTGATVTASPSVTTTYTVIGVNQFGCEATTTVTVTVVPYPVVTVDPTNPAACNGQPVSITASGATTYAWSPATGLNTTTGPTVTSTPAATTTYTVTGTTQGCSTSVDVTVAFQVVVNTTAQICQGDSFLLPDGVSASTSGTYTSILVSTLGCDSIINTNLTVTPLPTVQLSGTPAICTGGTGTISVNFTGVGPFSYLWTDGTSVTPQTGAANNTISVQPSATTTYSVISITDNNNPACTSAPTQTFQVTVVPPLQVALNIANSGCTGSCTGQLTAVPTGGAGNYSYQWTGPNGVFGGNNANQNNVCAADYTVVVNDNLGCSGSALGTVDELPLLQIDNLVQGNPLCASGCTGTIAVDAPTATAYSLSGTLATGGNLSTQGIAGNATDIGQLCAGNYTLTLTSAAGCTTSAPVVLTAPPLLSASISDASIICPGTPITLNGESAGGSGNVTFTWNPGSIPGNTLTIAPNVTAAISVVATDDNGCTANANTIVTVYSPLIASAVTDATICQGESVTIGAAGANGSGAPYGFAWSANGVAMGSTPSIMVTPAVSTNYNVVVTDQCGQAFAEVVILVNPAPVVSISPMDTIGCAPFEVTFNVSNPDQSVANCQWDFGNGQTSAACGAQTVVYDTPGCHDVLAVFQSDLGCATAIFLEDGVCVYNYPNADFTWSPNEITTENPVVEFTNLTPFTTQTLWDMADLGTSILPNPVFTFPDNRGNNYLVCLTIIDIHGCSDQECKVVTVDSPFAFWCPNAFTPNNNDLNETFKPVLRGHDPDDYWFAIYNRWGEKVFETRDSAEGWNGSFEGNNFYVEGEVYVWRVEVKEIGQIDKHVFKGRVMMVR